MTSRFTVRAAVTDALSSMKAAWKALALALVPVAILNVITVASETVAGPDVGFLGIVALMATSVFYLLYAVSCHRIILIGKSALPNTVGLYWTWRETRFLGWSALIGLTFLLPLTLGLAVFTGLALTPGGNLDLPTMPLVLATLALLVGFPLGVYVSSRLSLILPATATDERPGLKASWDLSRGNGWRLTLALSLPLILNIVLAGTIGLIFELAGLGVLANLASTLVLLPFVAFGIAILSVSFRQLRRIHSVA